MAVAIANYISFLPLFSVNQWRKQTHKFADKLIGLVCNKIHLSLLHKFLQFLFYFYSQLSLRRTPLGPALSVSLREVSVL